MVVTSKLYKTSLSIRSDQLLNKRH